MAECEWLETRAAPERLSSAQAALWHSCRHEGGNAGSTVARVFEIDGPLDVNRLRSALARVMERHDVLRAVFVERDGEPVRAMRPGALDPLPVTEVPAGEAERWMRFEASRSVDPAEGPLLQAHLAHTGRQKYVLVVRWHHIISDQRSGSVLDREIGALYRGDDLKPPPLQYGDYAARELTRLSSPEAETARNYWRRYLDGAPPLIDPGFGRARPAEPGHEGRTRTFELDAGLVAQTRAFGRKRRVTLFPVFLAAWAVLLNRYCGLDDLVLGIPVSGRDTPELEDLIGCFVNVLPVRVAVRRAAAFEDLVRECWANFLECARSALPFDEILKAVRPERSRSYSPLFQFALNYLVDRGEGLRLEGVNTTKIPCDDDPAPFDVTAIVIDKGSSLRLRFKYNSALFDARMIQQMGGHFIRILREATAPEAIGLGAIRMLSPEERDAILIGRNATAEPITREDTALTCFERQAARKRDGIAIVAGGNEWSWGVLSLFAERVRQGLLNEGVRPGDVVAAMGERSAEIVATLLGVWKCGAVWLPIDPRWPEERRQFVVRDSGAGILIDGGWLKEHLPATASATQADARAEALAYILYTSGSSGRPKGVGIRHDSLLNCLTGMRRRPGFGPEDTLLSVTSPSFDISLCEILLPLISGGKLVLPDLETVTRAPALRRVLDENEVTVMQATPVLWRSLMDDGWRGGAMRAWCGGEAMPPDLAERLLEYTVEVWNLYGPTETTIWSTAHRVMPMMPNESPVPIGRPMANTQCYVLDAELQPVPDGTPGELFIGGAGVSPGYVGHARAAQENFLANPFPPGGRMYRTGDTALWSLAGDLVFLDRKDRQVKLRGHRIELAEVESALSRLPGVRQAAAGVRDDALVAWVAPEDAAQWEPARWRAALLERLPTYMAPGVFVRIDRLPVNSGGKVDRTNLPPPEPVAAACEVEEEPGLVEQALKDLWQELLGVHPIRLDDNFFDLGGHSLLAVKLLDRMEKVFGQRLPEAMLFQQPTIAAFALAMRSQPGAGFSSLAPIQPLGSRPPLFCVHGGNGSILNLRELGRSLGADQPVYGLQSIGVDGRRPHHTRIEDMASHYILEVRQVQPEGPYYLCGYCLGGLVVIEMARQLMAAGRPVAHVSVISRTERSKAAIPRLLRRVRTGLRKIKKRAAPALEPDRYERINAAHKLADRLYRPRPCAHAVTVFKTVPPPELPGDTAAGWHALAPGGLEIVQIPGTHVTALQQPCVKVLAAELGARLRLAQARVETL